MATKIRLQRFGRKNKSYFHIVIADSHSPRDGKFIEHIGTYDPNTNPASINLNFERALHWLDTGAIPSETANAILSYKGVLYKNHLLRGVKKNALTAEQAEEKFKSWMEAKEAKVEAKKSNIIEVKDASRKAQMEAETKVNIARTEKFAAKRKAELEALTAPAETEEAENEVENEAATETEAAVAEENAPVAEDKNETPE